MYLTFTAAMLERQKVRCCLLAIPTIEARWETIHWFREEFERARSVTDSDIIQSQLQYGRMQLKQVTGGLMLHSNGNVTRLRGLRNFRT